MTHTSGPWHWHDLGTDWTISDSTGSHSVIAPDRKPTKADAILMTASPDLLAALQELNSHASHTENMLAGLNIEGLSEYFAGLHDAQSIARAAIAKATQS